MNPGVPFAANDMSSWFWQIIEQADKDGAKLRVILDGLTDEELYRFALEFMLASDYIRQRPYIDYLYVGRQKSEDAIADMSYWVVSQGRDFYEAVRQHPELVSAYEVAEVEDPTRAHSFEFTAESILEDRLGEWPDTLDEYDKFLHSGYGRVSDYWEARQAHEPPTST